MQTVMSLTQTKKQRTNADMDTEDDMDTTKRQSRLRETKRLGQTLMSLTHMRKQRINADMNTKGGTDTDGTTKRPSVFTETKKVNKMQGSLMQSHK